RSSPIFTSCPLSSPTAPPDLRPLPTRRSSDLHELVQPEQQQRGEEERRAEDGPDLRGARGVDGGGAHRLDRLGAPGAERGHQDRSEEHTSELQSRENLVCRLLLEKKKKKITAKINGKVALQRKKSNRSPQKSAKHPHGRIGSQGRLICNDDSHTETCRADTSTPRR